MWPFVNGKETKWRYNAKYDPAAKNGAFDFYGKPDQRALDLVPALRAAAGGSGRRVSLLAQHGPRRRALALGLDDPADPDPPSGGARTPTSSCTRTTPGVSASGTATGSG